MSKARTLANLISDNAELADGQISVAEVVGAAPTASPTFTGNIDAGDNVKIRLGDSDDLQIYHDGSNSYINEVADGDLLIRTNGSGIRLQKNDGQNMVKALTGGAVQLYYNNQDKLATTATGIDVTGTVTSDGLTVDGDASAAGTIGVTLDSGTIQTGKDSASSRSHLVMNNPNGVVAKWDTNGTDLLHYVTDEYKLYTAGNKAFEIDGNGDISFYEDTGTTAKFFWDASAESLGIGTSTPAHSLDVVKAGSNIIRVQNSTSSADASFYATNTVGTGIFGMNATGQYMYGLGNFPLLFYANGSERMRITSTGQVGIGTSSPSAKLGINAAAPDFTLLQSDSVKFRMGVSNTTNGGVTGSASGDYFARTAGGKMLFSTNDGVTAHATIDSSGNVGIGGTPSKPLHLKTPSGWATMRLEGGTDSGGELEFYRGSTKAGAIFFDSSSNLNIRTGNTERMRIDSSGSLLVGSTSKVSFPSQTVVFQAGGSGTAFVIERNDSLDVIQVTTFANTSVNRTHYSFRNSNGSVGTIQTNGSSTSYNTSSDYRLKENVVDLTGASARVNQLNPSRFNFISDADKTVDGFLAHEVATVVPEAIAGAKDAMMDEEYEVTPATGDIYTPATEAYVDDDGNNVDAVDEVIHSADAEQPETLEDGQQWRETTAAVMGTRNVPDYQGIDQSKLVPLLTAALQEALTKIDAMETRLTALEG